MNLKISQTTQETCEQILRLLIELTKKKSTVAISGGSTPKMLFELIANHYPHENWDNIKFFWTDERLVPAQSPESNFGEFSRILIEKNIINLKNVFQIDFFIDHQNALENIQNKILQNVVIKNSLPSFDLIILGVGEDGHIASIFPDNLKSFDSKNIVEIAIKPETLQPRISLTGSVINNAQNIAVLCTGKNKNSILKQIIKQKDMQLPASFINQNVIWFLDSAAGENLTK